MGLIYYNGEYINDNIAISHDDRGYQFGDGIYEVVRVYEGRLFTAEAHFERLLRSASEIQIELASTVDDYIAICERLIAENRVQDGLIYVQVTRGIAKRNHIFPESTEPVTLIYSYDSARPVQGMEEGVKVITLEDIRWLRCDIKSLEFAGQCAGEAAGAYGRCCRGCSCPGWHRDRRSVKQCLHHQGRDPLYSSCQSSDFKWHHAQSDQALCGRAEYTVCRTGIHARCAL